MEAKGSAEGPCAETPARSFFGWRGTVISAASVACGKASESDQGSHPASSTSSESCSRSSCLPNGARSEEHTSELQSLMRISYAVFCLNKKITTVQTPQT